MQRTTVVTRIPVFACTSPESSLSLCPLLQRREPWRPLRSQILPLLAALGLRYINLNVGLRVRDPALEPTHPGQLPYRAQKPPVGLLLPATVELEEGRRHPLTIGEVG